jgi:hypothetical protein
VAKPPLGTKKMPRMLPFFRCDNSHNNDIHNYDRACYITLSSSDGVFTHPNLTIGSEYDV